MQRVLTDWMTQLRFWKGSGSVTLVVGAQASLWELTFYREGAAPAEAGALQAFTRELSTLAGNEGLTVLFGPTLFQTAPVTTGEAAERLGEPTQGALLARARGEATVIDAAHAIVVAHELAESATLKLGDELHQMVKLSEKQCAQVEHMAHAFDAGGGLADTLSAAEREVSAVEARFRAALTGHSGEVAKASGHAHTIAKLAGAVGEIAQAARMLTFNARVESARLGDAGKGFAVIANAIRELARDLQASNELVTRLASTLTTALPALERTASDLSSSTEAQLGAVRGSLEQVRQRFQSEQQAAMGQLTETRSAAHALRDRSQAVVQNLQFQDRASQLLMHAKSQIEALELTLGVAEQPPVDLGERAGTLGRTLGEGELELSAGDVALF